jgi:osmotically-inducible protein OsmY
MKLNEELYKEVVDKLNFEPSLTAENIVVGVKDGVVTLTGQVNDQVEKVLARDIVSNIEGVHIVIDKLEVKILKTT